MATAEPARHALYSRLEVVLGTEHTETLMTHLLRGPSDEVATKEDISHLEQRFDRMEQRFDRMEERMDRMQGFYVATTVGSMTALTAIFSLVVGMLG